MRVSSETLYRQGVAGMLDRQSTLLKVQQQLATGLKHVTAGDSPSEFSEALSLDQRLADLARYKENANAARHRLNVEDSTLGSVSAVLQRVRELAVQGNNDALSDQDRSHIVAELREQYGQLLNLANQEDGQGNYIFAGSDSAAAPFARTATGVTYSGDQTYRYLAVGANREVADGDPGSEVFQRVKNGDGGIRFTADAAPPNTGSGRLESARITDPTAYNGDTYTLSFTSATTFDVIRTTGAGSPANVITGGTYTEGAAIAFDGVEIALDGTPAVGDTFTLAPSSTQDIFATVQGVIDALSSDTGTAAESAEMHNQMFNALDDLDQALDHVSGVRAMVGVRLNVLDDTIAGQEALDIQLQETLSGKRDLDYAEAISRLQIALTTLEASQRSFAKVQDLSLFNFLR